MGLLPAAVSASFFLDRDPFEDILYRLFPNKQTIFWNFTTILSTGYRMEARGDDGDGSDLAVLEPSNLIYLARILSEFLDVSEISH